MGNKSYLIHDNRNRPFRVIVTDNSIDIYTYDPKQMNDAYDYDVSNYTILVKRIANYMRVFIGKDNSNEIYDRKVNFTRENGNSILVQVTKHKYIFIGMYIYSFKIKDEIVKYFSPVGNNDVPYPYAIGTLNNYLMIEQFYVSNDNLITDDPYQQYYGHDKKKFTKEHKQQFRAYEIKMLQDRI